MTEGCNYPITQKHLFLFLSGCFGLHVVLRWLVSESAGIDDADQIIRAQIWNWGYGPQPPLYTWLTKIFLSTFGSNVVSMLLLKESLMLAIYVLVYFATREVTRNHLCALVATALLEANPSIAWEAHRELTHSVLASACALGTIYTFLRLDPARWRTYITFGLCSACGILSKYNFAVVWVALLLAALSANQLRPLLFQRKILVSVLLTLAVCAPHLLWIPQHRDLAFQTVWKLKMGGPGDWLRVADGLKKWLLVILADVGPTLGVVALVFWGGLRQVDFNGPRQKLLVRTLGWIILLVASNIILFKINGVRERYAQPLFVWVPLLFVSLVSDWITAKRATILISLAGTGAVVVALVAPGRLLLSERFGRSEVLNLPSQKLAADLKPAITQADCLIAETSNLGGNLRLWFPDKLVVDPEIGPLFSPGRRSAVVVWETGKDRALPETLLNFAYRFTGGHAISQLPPVEELLKHHQHRTIRLGVARIE